MHIENVYSSETFFYCEMHPTSRYTKNSFNLFQKKLGKFDPVKIRDNFIWYADLNDFSQKSDMAQSEKGLNLSPIRI